MTTDRVEPCTLEAGFSTKNTVWQKPTYFLKEDKFHGYLRNTFCQSSDHFLIFVHGKVIKNYAHILRYIQLFLGTNIYLIDAAT